MFSSITSYLWGAAEPEEQQNATEQPEQTTNETKTTTLETVPTEEDEWILVEKSGTSKMETSSMENLLIEHPSMSVYHHRGRQSSTGVDSENSESSMEEDSAKHPKDQHQAGLARHQPPHRPRALAARIGLVQAKTVKSMQRANQRHLRRDLSKNNLRRVNQTQGKHARKHIVQQPRQRATANTSKRQ